MEAERPMPPPYSVRESVDAETDMDYKGKLVDSEMQFESTSQHNVSIQMESHPTDDAEMQTLKEDELLAESAPALFRAKTELLDLNDEIRSRQRTLELLNLRLPEITDEVKQQLKVRDVRIEVLYHDNVTLRTLVKEKNSALSNSRLRTALKAAEEELAESKKARLALERRLQAELERFSEKTQQFEEELEATNLLNEMLNEEVEGLRALAQAKEQQAREIRGDMMQLSEIINNMTQVNSELNSKIAGMNSEMTTLSQKYHEASVKASHVEEIEHQLEVAMNEASTNGKRADKYEKLAGALKGVYRDLEAVSREVGGKLGELANSIVEMGVALAGNDQSRFQKIKQIAVGINELKAHLESKVPEPGTSEGKVEHIEEITSKIAELECEVKAKDSLVAKLTQDEQDLKKRFDAMTEEHARAGKVWTDATEESKRRLNDFQQKLEQCLGQLSTVKDELSKLKENYARTKTELENKANSLEDTRHRLAEARELRSDLEKRLKSVFDEYSRAQELFKNKEEALKSAELKAQRILIGFGVMQEEIFKRENEYLSRERVIIQQQAEVDDAKARYSALQASVKRIVAKELETANAMLEEKDRECTILKEMIRSSHVEMKGKDSTILKYKVKYKEQAPSGLTQSKFKRTNLTPFESPVEASSGLTQSKFKRTNLTPFESPVESP
jgi:chromosome segregation ATPase